MTSYCKWCDTLTDDIVQDINAETGALVWTGCLSCKLKQVERNRKPQITEKRHYYKALREAFFRRKQKKPTREESQRRKDKGKTHEELSDLHSERYF